VTFVAVDRPTLAEDLWSYGEDDLAFLALELDDGELARVGVIAGRLLLSEEHAFASGASMLLAKACALAAVEVVEGHPRPLRRTRRRSVPTSADEAGLTRSSELPSIGEVFRDVCEEVAARFADRGFRYAKSRGHAGRRRGEFRDVVSFQSGRGSITVYATVESSALRRWRAEHGIEPRAGVMGGGMLQNLGGPDESLATWDLDDPATLGRVSAEIVAAIEQLALPYFARFDVDTLADGLTTAAIPQVPPRAAVEWLLAHGRRDAAEAYVDLVLTTDERLRRRVERLLPRYRDERARAPFSSAYEAEDVASAVVDFGLRRPA
jgi:hypothetical protein